MIDYNYCITHDIDWFCVINKRPIHVASNGGQLPHCFTKRLLARQHAFVMEMPIGDFEPKIQASAHLHNILEKQNGYVYLEQLRKNNKVIKDFQEIFGTTDPIELYTRSFKEMAKKGFYSYDKIDARTFYESELYQLITIPTKSSFNFDEMSEVIFPRIEADDVDFNNGEPLNLVELINRYYE